MSDNKLAMYVYDDATMELAVGKAVPQEYVAQVALSLFSKGYVENLAKSSPIRKVFCPVQTLLHKNASSARKLLKSVKRWEYGAKQETVAPAAKPLAKNAPEWNEQEMANRLAGLLPFNKRMQLQPTDEQLFGQAVVTQAEADKAAKDFQGKFTDFFSEVQKPISQLKKFASEEEEIAYWSSIGVSGSASSAD